METKLAVFLKDHSLSHRAFAKRAGLDDLHPMVSLWARGLARPSLETAVAIEKATDGAIPTAYWLSVPSRKNAEPPSAARVTRRRRGASLAHKRLPKRNS